MKYSIVGSLLLALIFSTPAYSTVTQDQYFSWLHSSQPGESVPLEYEDVHANIYFGKERHILVSELQNHVESSPVYLADGLKYGYKCYCGDLEPTDYFDGVSYYIDRLWATNRSLFPNKQFVPVSVSDITFFVESKGYIPISYSSPYVQRFIIKHQIERLLGRSWIYGYSSPDQQINSLINNAVEFADAHEIPLGQELSYNHQYLISNDMIWPEIHMVNGKSMLIPMVYLSKTTLDQEVDQNTIAFGSANLNYNKVHIDGAKVNVQRDLLIQAKEVAIANSIVIAGSLDMQAGSNIELLSTQMTANQINLSAERITNKTLVTRFNFDNSNTTTVSTPFGDVYYTNLGYGYRDSASQLGFIESFGDITINAREDFINQGANLNAQGTIYVEAGNNIAIVSQAVEDYTYFENTHWSDEDSSIQQIQSQLSASDITLLANNSIQLEAASLEAQGTIQLLAGMGIHFVESVNSISSTEKFEYESGGIFGSSESESEIIQKTELLSNIIKAGKAVVIRTIFGNISLRAVKLDTEGEATIISDQGLVSMEVAKTIDYYNYEYYSEDLMTFNTEGYGHYIETGHYNQIVALGGLALDAGKGIRVDYFGEDSFDKTIDRLSSVPELKWMADLRNNPNVNWTAVDLAYQQWDYEASGLTEVGSIIVAIAVSCVMPGSEAFLTSWGGTVGAAAMSAGVNSLATQAAIALIGNNGDPLKAMEQMGDNFDVRALATTMAAAGLMNYISTQAWFEELTISDPDPFATTVDASNVTDAVTFAGHAQDVAVRALTQATVSSGMSYVIQGGGLDDMGDEFLVAVAQNSINLIGKKFAQEIGDAKKSGNIETSSQYLAHAALGCVIGTGSSAVTNGDFQGVESACASGAGGGVIGEFVAQQIRQDFFDDVGELRKDNNITPAEYRLMYYRYKSFGVDMAKLAAALTAYNFGGDVQIAADVGANAAENNAFWFLVIPAYMAFDKAYTLYEYGVFAKELGEALKEASQTGDYTTVNKMLEDKALEIGIDAAVGKATSTLMKEIAEVIAKNFPEAVDSIKDLLDYSSHYEAGTTYNITPGKNSGGRTEPRLEDFTNPDFIAMKWSPNGTRYPAQVRLSGEQIDEIKSKDKLDRNNADTYMAAEDIAEHLAGFEGGASRLMIKEKLEARGGPAHTDGTAFVMPSHELDRLIEQSAGDVELLAVSLGLPRNTFVGQTIQRVDFPNPSELGIRVPSGREAGANDDWIPGGYLPTGYREAVIDVPPGDSSVYNDYTIDI